MGDAGKKRKGQRIQIPLSASPTNPDAMYVMGELQSIPKGQWSAHIWFWCRGYLEGRGRAIDHEVRIDEAELEDLLDNL